MRKVLALLLTVTFTIGLAAFAYADGGQLYAYARDYSANGLHNATPANTATPAQPPAPESAPEQEPEQNPAPQPPVDGQQAPQLPFDGQVTQQNAETESPAGPENGDVQDGGQSQAQDSEAESAPWWQSIPFGRLFTPMSLNLIENGDGNAVAANLLNFNDPVPVASPSVTSKATGITDGSKIGAINSWVTLNGQALSGSLDNLSVEPGDELLIHFKPDFFKWDIAPDPSEVVVPLSSIRGKISLRYTATKNSKVFDSIDLTSRGNEAVIRVKFKHPLPIRQALDFKTTLYLVEGGLRHYASEAELAGSIENEILEVYDDFEELDISDGTVCIAMEPIHRIKLYLGEGVYADARHIRKNSKFYGVAILDEYSRRDDEISDEHPDIVEVYTLHTFGLNGAGNKVEFEDAPRNYYVYGSDLEYLGRSHQKVDFRSKYYLAAKELTFPSVSDDIDEIDEIDGPPTLIEYEDPSPEQNGNANPYTGR